MVVQVQSFMFFRALFSKRSDSSFSYQKYFSIFLSFFCLKSSISAKIGWQKVKDTIPFEKQILLLFNCENLFFATVGSFTSPPTTEDLDNCFELRCGFLYVSKFTNEVILLVKFSKPSPLDPFLIPLFFI